MLAAKFFDDHYYNNVYFAKVGGVLVQELNHLEMYFLFISDFSLAVSPETYRNYYQQLIQHALSDYCSCCSGMCVYIYIYTYISILVFYLDAEVDLTKPLTYLSLPIPGITSLNSRPSIDCPPSPGADMVPTYSIEPNPTVSPSKVTLFLYFIDN